MAALQPEPVAVDCAAEIRYEAFGPGKRRFGLALDGGRPRSPSAASSRVPPRTPGRSPSFRLTAPATSYIVVGVRMRPLIRTEMELGGCVAWSCEGDSITAAAVTDPGAVIQLGASRGLAYNYHHVFDPSVKTAAVYARMGTPIIEAALEGYNGTIFAYGQTASGKTHTLTGSPEEPGVSLLAVRELFEHINASKTTQFLVRVSYVELYNEEIRDLLADPDAPPLEHKLTVADHPQQGPYVRGVQEHVVMDPQSVLELLAVGEASRHVAATDMNSHSSRSHTLFRMVIESRKVSAGDPASKPGVTTRSDLDVSAAESLGIDATPVPTPRTPRSFGWGTPGDPGTPRSLMELPSSKPVRVSVVNLVDLAGSERVGKSGVKGVHLKEGTYINKSLVTLGTVISKLASGTDTHIPYRESKLTRLLSNSLGGNAKTAVIVTISPSTTNISETRGSLQFALRAKKVVNRVLVNEVADDSTLLQQYEQEIQQLRKALASGGGGLIRTQSGEMVTSGEMMKRIQRDHEQKQSALEGQLREQTRERRAVDIRLSGLMQLLYAVCNLDTSLADAATVVQAACDVATGRRPAADAVAQAVALHPPLQDAIAGMDTSSPLPDGSTGDDAAPSTHAALARMLQRVEREATFLKQYRANTDGQVDKVTADNEALTAELAAVKTELTAQVTLNKEFQRHAEKSTALMERISKVVEERNAAQAAADAAEKQVETLTKQLADATQSLEQRSTAADELRDSVAAETQSLRQQCEALTAALADADVRVAQHAEAALMAAADKDAAVLAVTDKLQAVHDHMDTEVQTLQQQLSGVRQEVDSTAAYHSALSLRCQTLDTDLETCRRERDAATAATAAAVEAQRTAEATVACLSADLDAARQQGLDLKATLEAERSTGESEREALQAQRDRSAAAQAAELSSCQRQVQELEAELRECQTELRTAGNTVDRLQVELDAATSSASELTSSSAAASARVTTLTAELSEANHSLQEAEERLQATTADLAHERSARETAEARCDTLHDSLVQEQRAADVKNSDAQHRLTELSRDNDLTASRCEELQSRCSRLSTELTAAREQLHAERSAVSDLRATLTEREMEMDARLADADSRTNSLTHELERYQDALAAETATVVRLRQDAARHSTAASNAASTLASTQAKITSLTSRLETAAATVALKEARIEELHQRVDSLQRQVDDRAKDDEIDKLQAALRRAEMDCERQEDLEAACERLQAELQHTQQELAKGDEHRSQLEDRLDAATVECESLRNTLASLTDQHRSDRDAASRMRHAFEVANDDLLAERSKTWALQRQLDKARVQVSATESLLRVAQDELRTARHDTVDVEQQLATCREQSRQLREEVATLQVAQLQLDQSAATKQVQRVRQEVEGSRRLLADTLAREGRRFNVTPPTLPSLLPAGESTSSPATKGHAVIAETSVSTAPSTTSPEALGSPPRSPDLRGRSPASLVPSVSNSPATRSPALP